MPRGQLLVFCGPMFSGKTGRLLGVVREAEERCEQVVVFKPAFDRSTPSVVQSHDGGSHVSHDISTASEIRAWASDADLLAIDEIQFFAEDAAAEVRAIADQTSATVVAAGLDRDFRGAPFEVVRRLVELADKAERLTAVCSRCGEPAEYTQRLLEGSPAPLDGPVFLVGGSEVYQPRCSGCFHAERETENPT